MVVMCHMIFRIRVGGYPVSPTPHGLGEKVATAVRELTRA